MLSTETPTEMEQFSVLTLYGTNTNKNFSSAKRMLTSKLRRLFNFSLLESFSLSSLMKINKVSRYKHLLAYEFHNYSPFTFAQHVCKQAHACRALSVRTHAHIKRLCAHNLQCLQCKRMFFF